MRTLALTLRVLALAIWVGGLVFFAFVVAPIAFLHLPSAHLAGLVVGSSLRVLHWMGLSAGVVLLVTAMLMRPERGRRAWGVGMAAVGLMLALTAASQFVLLPRMERDRLEAGGDVQAGQRGTVAERTGADAFERLHQLSERMEGGVLLLGVLAVVCVAVEMDPARAR